MVTKKRNVKKTAVVNKAATKPRRRQNTVSRRKGSSAKSNTFNFVLPLVFIVGLLCGLGFLLFKGVQTVAASTFFDVKKIEVRGTVRVPKDEIEKIVRQRSEREGVWTVELEQIRAEVEKFTYIKSAVVSRILPDGVLVQVEERNPRAAVRLENGDFWVDDDASIFAPVGKNEKATTTLFGWGKETDAKTAKENQQRLKIFLKAQEEFKTAEITKRINVLNISDLQDVVATVEDSGATVVIKLGKEDFGKRLKNALTVIEGKGQTIESLISRGGNVVVTPRNVN